MKEGLSLLLLIRITCSEELCFSLRKEIRGPSTKLLKSHSGGGSDTELTTSNDRINDWRVHPRLHMWPDVGQAVTVKVNTGALYPESSLPASHVAMAEFLISPAKEGSQLGKATLKGLGIGRKNFCSQRRTVAMGTALRGLLPLPRADSGQKYL